MNSSTKKKLFATGVLISLLTYHSIDYKYTPTYEIEGIDNPYFATYSLGKMYIGDKNFLKAIKDYSENDIFVLDERNSNDPNMKIYNSSLIFDKNVRNEILEVICRYEEMYPSNWSRSIESMRVEWFMHNISYYFDFEKNRAKDVDLNNNDEEYYKPLIYRKILKL